MFGFGKKRERSHPIELMLKSPPSDYVKYVKTVFDHMQAAERAHVLVAYKNFEPMVMAMDMAATKDGEKVDRDAFIVETTKSAESKPDEVNRRRYAWFSMAALLHRAGMQVGSDENAREIVASIWCDLARAAPLLKELLPHNIVWAPKEKVWFEEELSGPDDGLVLWAVNIGAPKQIWDTRAVRDLAREFGFRYIESTENFGPLWK